MEDITSSEIFLSEIKSVLQLTGFVISFGHPGSDTKIQVLIIENRYVNPVRDLLVFDGNKVFRPNRLL